LATKNVNQYTLERTGLLQVPHRYRMKRTASRTQAIEYPSAREQLSCRLAVLPAALADVRAKSHLR